MPRPPQVSLTVGPVRNVCLRKQLHSDFWIACRYFRCARYYLSFINCEVIECTVIMNYRRNRLLKNERVKRMLDMVEDTICTSK